MVIWHACGAGSRAATWGEGGIGVDATTVATAKTKLILVWVGESIEMRTAEGDGGGEDSGELDLHVGSK